jgi:hypothetical protein
MRRELLLAALGGTLAMGTACGPRYVAVAAPPPPNAYAAPAVRIYDRGFREGYAQGRANAPKVAPAYVATMEPGARNDYRHGFNDGYSRGRYDQRHNAPWPRY